MTSTESALSEQPARAFTVSIPLELRPRMDQLPPDIHHTLLGELFRLAAQAGHERGLLPRHGSVTFEFFLAGCDVGIELNASRALLSLVSLGRGGP